MPENNREKRKLQRLPLSLEAICEADGAFFKGYVQDISAGGLKLETQKRLGQGVHVIMSIDTQKPLKLSGVVRWRRREKLHFLYGIQFEQLSEEKERLLRELVQSLFWKSYGG